MKKPTEPQYLEAEEKLNQGHRVRLRERFEKLGAEALQDYEILELLLTYSIPRRDVKDLAKHLLLRFGSLAAVMDAEVTELLKVDGMGARSAVLLRLVKEMRIEYHADKLKQMVTLSSPTAVGDFARHKLAGLRDEAFMVIFLNTKNKVLGYDINSEGTVDQAAVYPRKIVRKALDFNASGLILAHNHPSGDIIPSDADARITKLIVNACSTMDIRVLDHLVVGSTGFFSFKQHNLF